jgi:hypothetical protein
VPSGRARQAHCDVPSILEICRQSEAEDAIRRRIGDVEGFIEERRAGGRFHAIVRQGLSEGGIPERTLAVELENAVLRHIGDEDIEALAV